MNPGVDQYLLEGCGRCPYGGTPQCKVHRWEAELPLLRRIALDCGLTEEIKWSMPCYTDQGKNILIVSAFKEYCAISFFKGVLLQDEGRLLVSPGENSQAGRYFKFTSSQQILEQEELIKAYIFELLELEKAGVKVPMKSADEQDIAEEFQSVLDADPVIRAAFYALTPGKRRGYLLHFAQPKQSQTKKDRIEKCIPMILSGKGLQDEYKSRN